MTKHKIAFVSPGKMDVSNVEEGLAGLADAPRGDKRASSR